MPFSLAVTSHTYSLRSAWTPARREGETAEHVSITSRRVRMGGRTSVRSYGECCGRAARAYHARRTIDLALAVPPEHAGGAA